VEIKTHDDGIGGSFQSLRQATSTAISRGDSAVLDLHIVTAASYAVVTV
jgi:hypothetical protein